MSRMTEDPARQPLARSNGFRRHSQRIPPFEFPLPRQGADPRRFFGAVNVKRVTFAQAAVRLRSLPPGAPTLLPRGSSATSQNPLLSSIAAPADEVRPQGDTSGRSVD